MRRSFAVTATASLLATAPAIVVLGAGSASAESGLTVQTTAPGVLGIAADPTAFTVKVTNSGQAAHSTKLAFTLAGANLNPALGGLGPQTVALQWQDNDGAWRDVAVAAAGSDSVTAALPQREFGSGEQVVKMRVRVAPKAPAGPDGELATFNSHDPSAPKPADPANPYGHITLTTTATPVGETAKAAAGGAATDTDTVKLGAPVVSLVNHPTTHAPGGTPKEFTLKIDNATDSTYTALSTMLAFDLTSGNDSALVKLESSSDGKAWKPVPAMEVPGEMINPLPGTVGVQPRSAVEQQLRMSFTGAAKPGDGVTYLAADVLDTTAEEPAPIAEFCGERGKFAIVTTDSSPGPSPTPSGSAGPRPTDTPQPVPSTPSPAPVLADTGGDDNSTTLIGAAAAALILAGGGIAFAVHRRRA
ncbi:hypothetical protein [Streptodolium elevatio]|uniref:Gram-positive cocci surface proteins LPxTG domain-containing protein n=1 Tax=Streptodolium elevatio TaxID=3157996 RepID=A0ABV3DGP8_9ACTN